MLSVKQVVAAFCLEKEECSKNYFYIRLTTGLLEKLLVSLVKAHFQTVLMLKTV